MNLFFMYPLIIFFQSILYNKCDPAPVFISTWLLDIKLFFASNIPCRWKWTTSDIANVSHFDPLLPIWPLYCVPYYLTSSWVLWIPFFFKLFFFFQGWKRSLVISWIAKKLKVKNWFEVRLFGRYSHKDCVASIMKKKLHDKSWNDESR